MDRWDTIVVGSGFGGSVSAHRLTEKGHRVLVIEKGRRFAPTDFPKTNWNLRKFMWNPSLGMRGPFKMTFFRHVTIFSGVGVGGGSLVYANTLPVPKRDFFHQGSWASLRDWEKELEPHYATAKRMLGVAQNPYLGKTDRVLEQIAAERGQSDRFQPTDVGVFFGEPGVEVDDPYFGGQGPKRTGCLLCGGCMLGCPHGAKNTLDRNYLWLAERGGATVLPETTVEAVRPAPGGGYLVECRPTFGFRRPLQTFQADRVVLAGGVLGTVDLLLQMKARPDGLPALSDRLGEGVRTNSEAIIGVTGPSGSDYSKGVAIGSILHTDDKSHLEPVRYPPGAGLFRVMVLPHAPGATMPRRLVASARTWLSAPGRALSRTFVKDWGASTAILLYMRAAEGTLAFERGPLGMRTRLTGGEAPTASLPEASELAERFAHHLDGYTVSLFTETLLGIPSTAHILGGACLGKSASDGVIDENHQVFGYPGLYVCDGSAVPGNPGVNPSLTITAMTERAMAQFPSLRSS